MKQITIDTVRERIAELEMVNSHGELSLRGEFEMACLRMLADSMDVKPFMYGIADPDGAALMDECCVSTSMAGIEDYVHMLNEECEEVGPRFKVVPLYTVPPVQVNSVDDDVRNVVVMLENNEWVEHCTKTELGQRLESEITCLIGDVQPVTVVPDELNTAQAYQAMHSNSLSGCYRDGWNDCRAKVIGNMFLAGMDRAATRKLQELTADNTAQQFEALATSGKSEHLLNAERIAREAQALADRLNATSAVDDDMICYGERCKVCDEMIIGRSSDGLCVSCRDESTSAESGKP